MNPTAIALKPIVAINPRRPVQQAMRANADVTISGAMNKWLAPVANTELATARTLQTTQNALQMNGGDSHLEKANASAPTVAKPANQYPSKMGTGRSGQGLLNRGSCRTAY